MKLSIVVDRVVLPDGQLSRMTDLTSSSWSAWIQLNTNQKGVPGNPLVGMKLRMMDGYSPLEGSGSYACPLIGGHIRVAGRGVGSFSDYCILNYQRLSFSSYQRSDSRTTFPFLSHTRFSTSTLYRVSFRFWAFAL